MITAEVMDYCYDNKIFWLVSKNDHLYDRKRCYFNRFEIIGKMYIHFN